MFPDQSHIILIVIILLVITYHGYTNGWFGQQCESDILTKLLRKNRKDPLEQQIDILVEEVNTGNVRQN